MDPATHNALRQRLADTIERHTLQMLRELDNNAEVVLAALGIIVGIMGDMGADMDFLKNGVTIDELGKAMGRLAREIEEEKDAAEA